MIDNDLLHVPGPNQWPQEGAIPGFRDSVLEYYESLSTLAMFLTRLFFRVAGAKFGNFSEHFERPSIGFRMLHYPPQPDPVPEGQYGSAPHTDYNFMTLLTQDDVSGLEVKLDDDSWGAVPPYKTEDGTTALVLNLGEMAHRWTNEGTTLWSLCLLKHHHLLHILIFCTIAGLRATPHRVINRSGVDRYSIAFFWDPQLDFITDAR